jgi:hypothetical protein
MSQIIYSKPAATPPTIPIQCTNYSSGMVSNVTTYWSLFTLSIFLTSCMIVMLSYIQNPMMFYSNYHPSIVR